MALIATGFDYRHGHAGLAAARARTGGRKPKLTPTQARDAQEKYDCRTWTVQQIADLYGVPRSTVYGYLNRTGQAEHA